MGYARSAESLTGHLQSIVADVAGIRRAKLHFIKFRALGVP